MIRIILLISLVLPISVNAIEPPSSVLTFIPPIIAATHSPDISPLPENPLTLIQQILSACQDGLITDGWYMNELENSSSQTIKIVEMKIIDPSWQFAEQNSMPIILAPGGIFSYSISHISGFLCENHPEHTERVMFIFSDGSFQKI